MEEAGGLLEEDALSGVVQHEALTTNQKPLQLQLLQVGGESIKGRFYEVLRGGRRLWAVAGLAEG